MTESNLCCQHFKYLITIVKNIAMQIHPVKLKINLNGKYANIVFNGVN
jgi:hypothetical protein